MTYWSRKSKISFGFGSSSHLSSELSASSSSMISLHRSMHSSQMYTPGPAMSFFTCFCDLPQNEHLSRSPPSPIRATYVLPALCVATRCVATIVATNRRRGTARPRSQACHPPSRRYLSEVTKPTPGRVMFWGCRRPVSVDLSGRDRGLLPAGENAVDDAVLLGLLGSEDLVAVDVLADLRHVPAGVLGQHVLEHGAHAHDLAGLDLDVRTLPVPALGGRLVDDDPRVRQGQPLARGTGGEQDRGGTGGLAHAHGLDVRPDVLHRVVDRGQRGERTTRRVDVDDDVAVRVGRLEHHQLRHHVVGRRVVDLDAEEDDALLEHLVVRVGFLDPVRRPLDVGRDDVTVVYLAQAGWQRQVSHSQLLYRQPSARVPAPSGTWVAPVITLSMKP